MRIPENLLTTSTRAKNPVKKQYRKIEDPEQSSCYRKLTDLTSDQQLEFIIANKKVSVRKTGQDKVSVEIDINGNVETAITCSLQEGSKIVNNLLAVENIIDTKT